jgi:two-component system chemotaxis sensor kinase CheA
MNLDLTQFYQVFFDEATEHLTSMETMLLGLDVADPSMDDLNAIFRAAHSIKGGAGTFGFTDMTEVTHVLENLLDKLRKQEMKLTDEMVNVFLEAGDVLAMQLAAHRGNGQVEQVEVEMVCEKLKRLTTALPVAESAMAAPVVAPEAGEDYGFFDDAAGAPVAQSDPGYGFFDDAEGAPAPQSDPGYGFFEPTPVEIAVQENTQGYGFFKETPVQQAEREHKQGYGFLQEIPDLSNTPQSPGRRATDAPDAEGMRTGKRATDKVVVSSQAEASSIRVSVEKVDQLINLVGELVITQAMLAQSAISMEDELFQRMEKGLHQLERNTRDLQESVMSIRMLPISFVFSRFPRVVRDLAGKLNKQVELKTLGESTELDKGLIEKIADPLTHLIRNSLDHGVEIPEKRIAAGKPAKGTITLNAFHQGGNIVIEVSDDGGGLNRKRILDKAKERGMQVSDDITDADVWMLIFEAGFSTAEVVTDVSGRGVGMDVVKRNIAELGGRIELQSAEGFGTRTTIRLPLTLAILDGLSLSVGSETYIVPLNSIVESLQVREVDLKTVSGGGRLLRVRGEYLPLVALYELFNITPLTTELSKGIVVIIESEGKKTALFVDDLLGQNQVVIKSLESNFRRVQGVSGATIMGDGKVALILDVMALSASHAKRERLAA